ncbi:sensor histidine kinase [Hymenobacter sediminicola]|uniref:Sensor histidine kinase n=1 Tax=Hymenobacter sediminicola TaxID=2761579 RepID=A0A7G7W8Y6_9BACT|nr:sensor histidine kinase [Hymenobacter sediminicola]QNH62829.1 sensor histidine kinase [Hymenobacter sediminicola]
MPVLSSAARPLRPRVWFPLFLKRLPWPHLAWLALLLYFDVQLRLLRVGPLLPALEEHFWVNALLTDLLDSGLFYLNWWLMPRLFVRHRLLAYGGALLAGLFGFVVLRIGLSVLLEEVKRDGISQPVAFYVQVLQAYYLLLGGLILLLSFFLRLAGDFLRERENRRELEQQHLRTELALLKTQLHPHFLFNTLNNIYSLTLNRSAQAPQAVLRLAELMRYQLYDSAADLVPLTREISHLRGFLDLQLLRLPPDVADEAIQLTVLLPPGAEYAYQLPPMLLLPLVENAFKHGDLAARPHVAQLVLQLEETGHLRFSVRNQVAEGGGPTLEEAGGMGLTNLRRRLALLYPSRHTLSVIQNQTEYYVTLTLRPA